MQGRLVHPTAAPAAASAGGGYARWASPPTAVQGVPTFSPHHYVTSAAAAAAGGAGAHPGHGNAAAPATTTTTEQWFVASPYIQAKPVRPHGQAGLDEGIWKGEDV